MQNKSEIQKQVAELNAKQPWNHNHILPFGVETTQGAQISHGKNLVKWKRLEPILKSIDLADMRVLDMGCNEGFFSLKMSQLAKSVVGIDVDEDRIIKAKFVQKLVGDKDNLEFDVKNIYSDEFNSLKQFDLCLCLGFIHRVPDPFTAIEALADKTDMIIFEWKALKFGPHDEAFAYFSPKGKDEDDFYGTEYWLLSYPALESILQRMGFAYFHRIDDPRQRRAILVAGRNNHPIFERDDIRIHRGRVRSLLSHGKRFLKTAIKIISGELNA